MSNSTYIFKIYVYGELVSVKCFNDYKSARHFYCSNYYQLDFAVVPYLDGVEMTFNEAYNYFSVSEYLKYHMNVYSFR
jgi:hypothetical protein